MYFVQVGGGERSRGSDPDATVEARQERYLRLLDPIWSQLTRYARAVANEDEAARDLLSEALALAWEHFDNLRDETAFKQYLFRIIARLNYRAVRRDRRHTPIDEALHERLHHEDLTAERALDVQLLYQAMERLPEKQREAVTLFEIIGLSLEEVRGVQGGSLSGVKTRVKRAREALARTLGVENANSAQPVIRNKPNSATQLLTIPLKAKL